MVYVSQTVSLLLVVIQLSNFIEGESKETSTVEAVITDYTSENYTTSTANSKEYEFTGGNDTESRTDCLQGDNNTSKEAPSFNNGNGTVQCPPIKNRTEKAKIIQPTANGNGVTGPTTEKRKPSYGFCQHLSPSLKVYRNVTCNGCEYYGCCNNDQSEKPAESETHLRYFTGYIRDDNSYSDIRVVTSCPLTYTSDDGIKRYCESSSTDLAYDLWLLTPVTDSETQTTYKNVFCAACNERPLNNIRFSNLSLVCYDKKNGGILKLQTAEQDGRVVSRLYPRSVGLWKYRSKISATADPFCFVHPVVNAEKFADPQCLLPTRESPTPLPLVSNYIGKNENNSVSQKYSDEESGRKDNLTLHDPQSDQLPPPSVPPPPPSDPRPPPSVAPPSQPITFKLNDDSEPSPKFSGCDDQSLRMANLRDILCAEVDGKAKCKLKLVECVERVYSNETKFTDYDSYDSYYVNNTIIFVCGPQVDDSIIDTGVASILNLLLYLLRGALIGLILYLLIFVWLPAKNTLDKSLGSFGVTLIIQIVCAIFERQKVAIPCKIVASIWHYSMLSNFTWMLILSYDCWLSLRQLFRVYQLVGEYDSLQFLIYFAVSQIIPVLVTIAALIFGKSPADWYCQKDLGLERYECLLSVVPKFWLFYLIPASFMFGLNIYFLARIGYLVFSRQQYLKEVRQKFKQRSGFALMLSPTWMLGSLLILTHFELPVCDILIVIVHVLQASFFLVYAFDQSLGRIMQKYDDIERNLFGETVYCPMSASVLLTEDRHLLGILEGRQTEQENSNLYSEELR